MRLSNNKTTSNKEATLGVLPRLPRMQKKCTIFQDLLPRISPSLASDHFSLDFLVTFLSTNKLHS